MYSHHQKIKKSDLLVKSDYSGAQKTVGYEDK